MASRGSEVGDKTVMGMTAKIPARLQRILKNPKVAEAAAVRAINRTALEARELLADLTPKDTGDTARRWQAILTSSTAAPGVVFNDSIVMVWIEYGTKPHVIVAKNAKALAFKAPAAFAVDSRTPLYRTKSGKLTREVKKGELIFRKRVNHPGTKGQFIVRGNIGNIRKMLADNMALEIRRALS